MIGLTRSRGVIVLALSVLLTVTACTGIPTSGAVVTGSKITANVQGDIEYLPSGPTAGSDQEKILRDFVEAGTGSQDDYAVAREYLTSSFAKKWDPQASVIVRQGSGNISQSTSTQATYTVQTAATVDASGHYSEARPATNTSLSFSFEKVGNEWRLSYAPPGIVLSTANFDLVFRPHAVYFFDPTYTYLVPDERWFLARASTTTRIASALLAGPSPWLRGAVVSAFPDGTQLALSAVTVSSGTADVDLTNEALAGDATARSRMRAQLVASFANVASVSAVDIRVQGASLTIPAGTGSAAVSNPPVDPRPLILDKGAFGFGTPSSVDQLSGLSKAIVALKPTAVEVSSKLNQAVVGTSSGVFGVSSDGNTVKLDGRPGLVTPSMDDLGFAWSAQAVQPRSLMAIDFDGGQHPLVTSLPADEQLVSFKVSRDGTRVALLLNADGTSRLLVAAIVRDSKHVPTGLGRPLEMTPPAGSPVGVTWVDELTVATLSTNQAGDSLVSEHDVGGETTDLGQPAGTASEIVGGNGADRVQVLTASSQILQPRGNGWEATGVSADLLATQR